HLLERHSEGVPSWFEQLGVHGQSRINNARLSESLLFQPCRRSLYGFCLPAQYEMLCGEFDGNINMTGIGCNSQRLSNLVGVNRKHGNHQAARSILVGATSRFEDLQSFFKGQGANFHEVVVFAKAET